ncbi:PREDICTED: uncharacterized protein LOC106752352 [Dinoponera quadriceps]|uniref:Uncharacterized protein LOC106752352 n=1 Tax=Dinoponera quadriceps TaxID=609295 RepID=A0A6P3YHR6_DINQU|nr:PREDICTED: uncharacterized protein LOC106752352 [Dinoponera quadriceps]
MPTHELILVASLLLRVISVAGDCRWSQAVGFWSDVICSMENCKTVNFHRVHDRQNSTVVSRCFDELVLVVARKCEMTILSRAYRSGDESFIDDEDAVRGSANRSSIWRITSSADALVTRPMIKGISPQNDQKDPPHERNTWNVHVILARDVRSFHRILRNEMFEWNPRDRCIVLIVHRKKDQGERGNEPGVSIEDILRTLWYERKVYNIFVSDGVLVNGTSRINRFVSTYNPFAKVNDSAWGGIDVVSVNTTARSSNLTYRCTRNLNGYELKVGIFEGNHSIANMMSSSVMQPVSMQYDYSNIFKGFDETILDIVARQMNFTAKRVHPTDNRSFGYQLPNGTYIGAIGDVVYGRTDVCFESFFVKRYSPYKNMLIEFTAQVEFDRVCVIVPKASKIPKWLRIYHFFPLSIWIFSMLSHVLTYITWHLLQVFNPRRTGRVSFLTTVYRSFLFNCGCPQKLPYSNAERILLSGIFLGNITIVGFFNGMLYKSFANDMYYRDIDSLEDLEASGLPILFTSFGVSDIFGLKKDTDATPLIQSLKRKLQHGYNAVINAAYYRNVSGLMRKHHFSILNEELVNTDGSPMLHLVKECPGTYYLSYLLPRNSILREKINTLIARLNQAGLPTLWTSRTIQRTVVKKKLLAKRQENKADRFVAFSLSDLQTSFFTLLVGLSLSTIVFCHERGWLRALLSRSGKSSSESKR